MNIYAIFCIILTLAVLIGYINHRFIKIHTTIAITIGALILSLLLIITAELGLISIEDHVTTLLQKISFHDLVIDGMLSFLLFAGAIRIDLNALKEQKWEITSLAIGGTIASTFIIATLVYYILPLFQVHLPWMYCLLFGALISPTDPIAVLSIFKEMKIPTKFSIIAEGESLFNDGVGIVIFLVLYELIFKHHHLTIEYIPLLFIQQAIGGIVYGGILGFLAFWLIKPATDHKIEMLITLLIVTAGYQFALFLDISGPLAMVTAGIFIGDTGRHFSMSKKTVEILDDFWEMIEEILNIILFLLIGLELLVIKFNIYQISIALLTIPLVLMVRATIVSIPLSLFKRYRSYSKGIVRVLTWGGLRGGLALALALALPPNPYRHLILSMTYAVVTFSIIVQGLTMKPLIQATVKKDLNTTI